MKLKISQDMKSQESRRHTNTKTKKKERKKKRLALRRISH